MGDSPVLWSQEVDDSGVRDANTSYQEHKSTLWAHWNIQGNSFFFFFFLVIKPMLFSAVGQLIKLELHSATSFLKLPKWLMLRANTCETEIQGRTGSRRNWLCNLKMLLIWQQRKRMENGMRSMIRVLKVLGNEREPFFSSAHIQPSAQSALPQLTTLNLSCSLASRFHPCVSTEFKCHPHFYS